MIGCYGSSPKNIVQYFEVYFYTVRWSRRSMDQHSSGYLKGTKRGCGNAFFFGDPVLGFPSASDTNEQS